MIESRHTYGSMLTEGSKWRLRAGEKEFWAQLTVAESDKCYLVVDRDHQWKLSEVLFPGVSLQVEVHDGECLARSASEFISFGPDSLRVVVVRMPSPPERIQRRKSERVKVLLDAVISLADDEGRAAEMGVLLRDLSPAGACITAPHLPSAIKEGEKVRLGFASSALGSMVVQGIVRRQIKRARGVEIGISFGAPTSPAAWGALVNYVSELRTDRARRGVG